MGWDQALVGQKAGSRLLLTIPPALAYGAKEDETQPLAGHTLLFVVDVLGSYDANATAKGTPAGALPAGFPQVKSASGAVPSVTSVKGVKLAKDPQSALLLKGTGPAIDAKKNFVVQLVQADAKTGKTTQSTWSGVGPQVVSGSDLLQAASAFKNANVGSRAVVLGPQPTGRHDAGRRPRRRRPRRVLSSFSRPPPVTTWPGGCARGATRAESWRTGPPS